jgi:two-component system chemotaxis response regulator CheY
VVQAARDLNLLGEGARIEIDDADYEAIVAAVLDGVDRRAVVRMIESWRLEPAAKRLARVGHQIQALARRMNKNDVVVEIDPHGLRLSSERFAPFWSAFIHVVRNAVDHGIEDEESRASRQSRIRGPRASNGASSSPSRTAVPADWNAAPRPSWASSEDHQRENLLFLPASPKAGDRALGPRGNGRGAQRVRSLGRQRGDRLRGGQGRTPGACLRAICVHGAMRPYVMKMKTILVVDDSSTVRQQVSMALKQAGFAILEAADGEEGLATVNQNPGIAMVVCDVNMPILNGLEMVERIKKQPEHRALPILMLTTEGQPSMIKRAKQAGAVGWIVKPFDANQLVEAARHLTKAA